MPVQPSFDTWTILFLLAAAHGFVVAFLLSKFKQGIATANRILALLIVLFAISMLYYVAYWTGYAAEYPWLNHWIDAIPFLYGPLMYYYLVQFNDERPSFTIRWHLLPFYLHVLFKIPFLIRELANKPSWLKQYFFAPIGAEIYTIIYMLIIAQCISLLVYAFFMLRLLSQEKSKMNKYAIGDEQAKLTWLSSVVAFYVIFAVSSISYWVLVYMKLLKIEYDYFLSGIMTVFIYWVGYKGFAQPEISNEQLLPAITEPSIQAKVGDRNMLLPIKNASVKKYRKSSLTMRDAEQGKHKLLQWMQEGQPWKNDSLKIQQVAEHLQLSSHHLSQIVNELCGQTWADFITTYRIEYAKKLLADKAYEGKVLAVAFDCGFSNKSTFNAAFKKNTGLAPSAFREQMLRKQTG